MEIQRKKVPWFGFIFLFIVKIKKFFKMVKRNISFYKKRPYYKNVNFARKENFILWESSCFQFFQRWEIRSFFDSKSWCKMIFSCAWNTMFFQYGKGLVLNFSEIRNTLIFWSKKLMEGWYFLGIFELLMIFQYLGNMVFRAV